MRILLKSIITLVVLSVVFACSKTTFVGSDIFPDGIKVLYKDDFDIIAKTIRRDSIVTYDTQGYMESLMCGRIEDPVFGTTEAEIFIDMHITSVIPPFQYVSEGILKKATLDSVVLVLAYLPGRFYGDSTVSHEITVSQLEREMIFKDTVFSTFSPNISDNIFGEKTLIPNYSDSIFVLEPGDTTATVYTEQLRIPLDKAFVQEMIEDTSIIRSDDNFTAFVKGLHIRSIPIGNSMWSMDNTRTSESPLNSIMVYFSREDFQDQETFRIFVDGDRSNYLKHDYTGSVIESFFDDEEKGDSILFLQGMAGPDIELDIPEFADPIYDDFLVNKAELEFYVLEDESSSLYEPIEQIILQAFDSDGDIIVTEDVFIAFQVLDESSFDGNLTETIVDGQNIKKYTAAMSVHALRMFNEENPDTRIRISTRNKRLTPNRSVIFGPGHSKFPMKFKLTYSK